MSEYAHPPIIHGASGAEKLMSRWHQRIRQSARGLPDFLMLLRLASKKVARVLCRRRGGSRYLSQAGEIVTSTSTGTVLMNSCPAATICWRTTAAASSA